MNLRYERLDPCPLRRASRTEVGHPATTEMGDKQSSQDERLAAEWVDR
jgi:hypothetical protein